LPEIIRASRLQEIMADFSALSPSSTLPLGALRIGHALPRLPTIGSGLLPFTLWRRSIPSRGLIEHFGCGQHGKRYWHRSDGVF
jgi:hypothetical protein